MYYHVYVLMLLHLIEVNRDTGIYSGVNTHTVIIM